MEGKKTGVIVIDDILTAGKENCKTCYNSWHLDNMGCVAACNCCDGKEFYDPIRKGVNDHG